MTRLYYYHSYNGTMYVHCTIVHVHAILLSNLLLYTYQYHCTYTHMHNIRTADYISQHIPYKFHSLCAGEAAHLSSDFRRICETYFPHAELAQIIRTQALPRPSTESPWSRQLSKSLLHTHNFYFWLVLLATTAIAQLHIYLLLVSPCMQLRVAGLYN